MSRTGTYGLLAGLAAFAAAWMFVVVRDERAQVAREDLPERFFAAQSIDTMKYSRDLAREKLSDPSFDAVMDAQMRAIAEAGATHAAVGTPYDDEFAPVLERWVLAARRHGLSVWFRGNFSGWEGWFGYGRIDEGEHKRLLASFLARRAYLFEDGDMLSPCPECENGGPGDPRSTKRANGYNRFLADEYDIARAAFGDMGKEVSVYPSMNADVARDVLGRGATESVGDAVLVDHYVKTAEAFSRDISDMHDGLGGIGVGEFGAPIPDIHGEMSEADQATFVDEALSGLIASGKDIPMVNYWVLQGGSTALLRDDGSPKAAYEALAAYFSPRVVEGFVVDDDGDPVRGATVSIEGLGERGKTSRDGSYQVLAPSKATEISFSKEGYEQARASVEAGTADAQAGATMRRIAPDGIWDSVLSRFRD